MKIGRISISWQKEKEFSSEWQLFANPKGDIENFLFSKPDDLIASDSDKTRKILDNINYSSDIKAKRRFAKFSYWIACVWLTGLFLVVACQGFKIKGFSLEDKGFIAIVTSTTASLLGFSYIVGKYLFGQANRDTKEQKEGASLSDILDKVGELIGKLKGD